MRYATLDTIVPPIYAKNIDEFNEYVRKYQAENEIILTKSNNISQKTLRNLPAASTWKRANHMEFQYIDGHQQIRVIYAIHYDEESETDPEISYRALYYFKGLLDVIPTDDVEEETKLVSCPENPNKKYYNYVNERYTGFTVDDCYSIDRNGSFLASLQTVYPASKPWVEKFQEDKLRIKAIPKEQRTDEDKEILSYDKIIVGWMNNPKYHRHNAWVKIINDANKTIHDLRMEIENSGHEVILVNTDAVKFIGKYDYPVSTGIGGFKYEWQGAKMYIKGVKAYAYNEDGKWNFKQAGRCRLDDIKPDRQDWELDEWINYDTLEVEHIGINEKKELYSYYGLQ